jgi:transposase
MDTHTVTAQESIALDTLGRRVVPRNHRSIEEKRRIVAETRVPGASVAAVARRYGVNANLVFAWRRQDEQGLLVERTRRGSGRRLVPVKLLEERPASAPAPARMSASGSTVWVEFPSGAKLYLAAEASSALLGQLIEALRG